MKHLIRKWLGIWYPYDEDDLWSGPVDVSTILREVENRLDELDIRLFQLEQERKNQP